MKVMMNKKLHYCESKQRYNFECEEYEGDIRLHLVVQEYGTIVKFCPFCGYKGSEDDDTTKD